MIASPDERGSALLLAMAATLVMLVLGAALVLVTSTETAIAARFARSTATLHAAEAAVGYAIADLDALPDWNAALTGAAFSSFADGVPGGRRMVGATEIDIDALTNQLRCGRDEGCGAADVSAATPSRPWGDNNPRWQLYAWGPLSALAPARSGQPGQPGQDVYVLVWIGDDQVETDGDPLRDAAGVDDPGHGTVVLTAQAVAGGGLRRILEVTVRRLPPLEAETDGGMAPAPSAAGGLSIVTWREVR